MTPEQQYKEDPMFHQVVHVLEALISKAELTPFEIRQAAMLACIRYEMYHAKPPSYLGHASLEGWDE